MNPNAWLAAFEPFGGRPRNRSWQVARRVRRPTGVELIQLPVNFALLGEAISPLIAARPGAILLLGEAPIREIAVESVALNRIHSEGADNSGAAPKGAEIVPGGHLALSVGWDTTVVAESLRSLGIPARPSFHAGTFACNAALYHALHHAAESSSGHPIRVGFLHLPRSYRGAGTDAASLVRGVERALDLLLSDACPPRQRPTP
jgi:pyroglutamyl-peptidase